MSPRMQTIKSLTILLTAAACSAACNGGANTPTTKDESTPVVREVSTSSSEALPVIAAVPETRPEPTSASEAYSVGLRLRKEGKLDESESALSTCVRLDPSCMK